MSARPWYKRFGADFVFGTMGLTLEERGAYSIIIDLIHDRGQPIPDDARFMAGILGVSTRKWRTIRDALIGHGKIYEVDGFLSNERCDADLAEAQEQARKQVESGAKGGRKRAENALNSRRNEHEPKKKPNEINESGQGTLKPTRSQKPDKKDISPPIDPPKKSKPRKKVATRLTEDWVLPDRGWSYARKEGMTDAEIERESRQFRDYHLARDNCRPDWDASWRTWVGNQDKFGRPKSGTGAKHTGRGRVSEALERLQAEGDRERLDGRRDATAGVSASDLGAERRQGETEAGAIIDLFPVRSGGGDARTFGDDPSGGFEAGRSGGHDRTLRPASDRVSAAGGFGSGFRLGDD